jgi:hypothetical protein
MAEKYLEGVNAALNEQKKIAERRNTLAVIREALEKQVDISPTVEAST